MSPIELSWTAKKTLNLVDIFIQARDSSWSQAFFQAPMDARQVNGVSSDKLTTYIH